ncbi:hypothetical protein D9758_000283 [Tetrapyrgos nigripes]|uniref:Elongation of fatty acids protein n=1 Tax=Tetrapyrgos nigripes TaxID=182062 RepID=A0A8H5H1M6_9AGAR|nr:hypothetical protein D9758_000283 [Tetrapyrgos nigripes]
MQEIPRIHTRPSQLTALFRDTRWGGVNYTPQISASYRLAPAQSPLCMVCASSPEHNVTKIKTSALSLLQNAKLEKSRVFEVGAKTLCSQTTMAPLADFLLAHVPFSLPPHLHSYIPGKTPLSTTPTVLSALISYLVVIFGIQAAMKNQPPRKLNALFQVHNVILSSGSLLLLVLMMEEIVPIIWKEGIFDGMCAPPSWTERMEFYYMINYYFKYLELLDTVFLAFKKKPLGLVLARISSFRHRTPLLLPIEWENEYYYYYYATAGGAKIWWKKYLTMMQIIQFVIDLFVVYFGSYNHFATAYTNLPTVGDCAGSEDAALFGCGLLTSYLFLFINFYFQTYKKKPQANGKANGKANGHANGKVTKAE